MQTELYNKQYENWVKTQKEKAKKDAETLELQQIAAVTRAGDRIAELKNYEAFPEIGIVGVLYLAIDTGKLYSWNFEKKEYLRADEGVKFGTAKGTACEGNDARLSDTRTPKSHTHGLITNEGKIGTIAGVVITDTDGSVKVASSGTNSQYMRGDGSWATPPDTVSNISLDTSTELTGAPEVSEGNGVIWYDSRSDSKGFNITIKLAGLDLETISLSNIALTGE